jgi:hypothetical protein
MAIPGMICRIYTITTFLLRFVYLLSCGCVMSEQAVKTVASDSCLVCNAPCSLPDDIVLINPSTELELKIAKDRLAFSQEKKKQEKLEKKKQEKLEKKKMKGLKKHKLESVDQNQINEPALLMEGSSDEEKKKKKKQKRDLEKKEKLPEINMVMPDLSSLNAPKTKAVASLYHANGEGENKGNYLTKGTFNRFAP